MLLSRGSYQVERLNTPRNKTEREREEGRLMRKEEERVKYLRVYKMMLVVSSLGFHGIGRIITKKEQTENKYIYLIFYKLFNF